MTEPPDSPVTHTHLTLYLPGLFHPWHGSDAEAGSFQTLETMLARADRIPHGAPTGYEDSLFALFGLHRDENNDLPVAAVTRMTDMGVIDNDWWLRADPVYLALERDRLILADARKLDITREEANRLVAEIMEVFAADGWLLKAPCPERWYLKPAHPPDMATTSLSRVAGRDVHPFLPRGADGKSWHTTLNEIQILLHTAAVNAEREQNGKLPVNSLWFWGGGRLPRITPVSWTQVWSNEPIALSLAKLSGIPGASAADGFDAWRRQIDQPGEYLVVLDAAHAAALYNDAPQWNEILRALEQNWMEPLWRALKSNGIDSVSLIMDNGVEFSLNSRQARRWWRRRRPLAAYSEPRN